MTAPDLATRLREIRGRLYPAETNPTYCAEPIDIDDARFLLDLLTRHQAERETLRAQIEALPPFYKLGDDYISRADVLALLAKGETPGIAERRAQATVDKTAEKSTSLAEVAEQANPINSSICQAALPDNDFPDAVMRAGYQAQADALAPKRPVFPEAAAENYRRVLELCDEYHLLGNDGLVETDNLKHTLEDHERWYHDVVKMDVELIALRATLDAHVAQARARAEQREQDAPYMRHRADCEITEWSTTLWSFESGTALREGVCTCGLAAIWRSGEATTP